MSFSETDRVFRWLAAHRGYADNISEAMILAKDQVYEQARCIFDEYKGLSQVHCIIGLGLHIFAFQLKPSMLNEDIEGVWNKESFGLAEEEELTPIFLFDPNTEIPWSALNPELRALWMDIFRNVSPEELHQQEHCGAMLVTRQTDLMTSLDSCGST